MPLFTSEEYKEICASRARLEAYKLSIQPYPILPVEDKQPESPREIIHRHSDMSSKDFARLQSLEGEVKYLRQKVEAKPQAKIKPKQKGYKGLR